MFLEKDNQNHNWIVAKTAEAVAKIMPSNFSNIAIIRRTNYDIEMDEDRLDTEKLIQINAKVAVLLADLDFRYSTSSGPGGQHANRSATRATLIFDIHNAVSLDEETRVRLLDKLNSRLDKNGILQISVQDSRSQSKNRETAVARFQSLLADALHVPKKRHKTRPSQSAITKRIAKKKKQGRIKKERSKKWSPDE